MSSFLHIGDRIALYHELSKGNVGAEGYSDTQVAIDVSDGIVAVNTKEEMRSEVRALFTPG